MKRLVRLGPPMTANEQISRIHHTMQILHALFHMSVEQKRHSTRCILEGRMASNTTGSTAMLGHLCPNETPSNGSLGQAERSGMARSLSASTPVALRKRMAARRPKPPGAATRPGAPLPAADYAPVSGSGCGTCGWGREGTATALVSLWWRRLAQKRPERPSEQEAGQDIRKDR